MTPASGNSPYCTPAQMVSRADFRTVAQLLSDSGAPLTQQQALVSTVLSDLLQEASGLVESAAMNGGAYFIGPGRNDLAALTGNQAQFLAGMVAGVTMMLLWERRPSVRPGDKPPSAALRAMEWLDKLEAGKRIFGFVETEQAGQISDVVETADQVTQRAGLVVEADRFFGLRVSRLGGGRVR